MMISREWWKIAPGVTVSSRVAKSEPRDDEREPDERRQTRAGGRHLETTGRREASHE